MAEKNEEEKYEAEKNEIIKLQKENNHKRKYLEVIQRLGEKESTESLLAEL